MEGAILKAKSYNLGYQGLMFPWESAFTGEEVCPVTAPTGQLEQHITGDISFAVWQYWLLTGDLEWLTNVGWPILNGAATFWTSRVTPVPVLGHTSDVYHIDGVIPPDEYAVNVSDSVYTNVVATMSLEFATRAAALVGQSADPLWSQVASQLYIPYNATGDFHPEYEGYKLGTTIKQADVVLLGFPLGMNMSLSTRTNDLKIYEAVTDYNGPAMTWAMNAVAYLEIGDPVTAAARFKRGYANAQPPFNVWTETPTGGAINFITGAGGFLQSVIYGYPGLRLKQDAMVFTHPQLPDGVTQLALTGVCLLRACVYACLLRFSLLSLCVLRLCLRISYVIKPRSLTSLITVRLPHSHYVRTMPQVDWWYRQPMVRVPRCPLRANRPHLR
jgi:trehalose/maltose hydrolase-like predicted phosphorylase